MPIHLPTLYLCLAVMGATMASALALTAWRDRDAGLIRWAWAVAVYTIAYVLFGLRDHIFAPLSIVAGNALLSLAISLFVVGLYEFNRLRPPLYVWVSPVLIALIAIVFLEDPRPRVIGLLCVLALQGLHTLVVALRCRRHTVGIGQYYLIGGFLLLEITFAIRAVGAVVLDPALLSPIAPIPLQMISAMVPGCAVILVAFGIVVMGKERSDHESRQLALTDVLTGLPNRRHTLDTLAQQLAAAIRAAQPLSVLMCDIDHFKQINDQHGHAAGDEALRQVAACLRMRLRAQDVAGRIGGEEFLVVLPQTSLEGATQLAENLRAAISELRIQVGIGKTLPLTISIGVCGGVPKKSAAGDTLIASADHALYRAKESGRNRVEVVAPESSIGAMA
jgi:diguanylate cyclase (GGDEF)-like protein